MIIGLVGLKTSGKTTIANYLVSNYGFIEYSIATPLKEIAKIFGFQHQDVYGSEEDKMKIHPILGISARTFLQKFGTEICREHMSMILPDMKMGKYGIIWIHLLQQFLNSNKNKNIVISDVRFEDEANTILEYSNALLLYIERDNVLKTDTHKSELLFDKLSPSITIQNNTTINELFTKIDKVILKGINNS